MIYGAGIIARNAFVCLSGTPFHLSIVAFMVSKKEAGVDELLGIPVISVDEGAKYKKNALILIAVMDKYYEEIWFTLQKEKFENVVSLTFESILWEFFREKYVIELWKKQNRKYLTLESDISEQGKNTGQDIAVIQNGNVSQDGNEGISLYRVCCHTDKAINEDIMQFDWEIPIQAGASLAKKRICSICDNQGENISKKNSMYCELTALYWVWKNDVSQYAGLCHYRRHFQLNRELLKKLAVSDIDVILTTPILNFPSVRWIYIHDHIEKDWDIMLEAIRNLQPQYYDTVERLQHGVFYYAYNMFIARKEILNDYCEWLFPILSYCEEKCGRKEDAYQNRYIGFLAERLMSIYFLYHDNQYKIVHAKKHFLT